MSALTDHLNDVISGRVGWPRFRVPLPYQCSGYPLAWLRTFATCKEGLRPWPYDVEYGWGEKLSVLNNLNK